jgi:putative endonuclease
MQTITKILGNAGERRVGEYLRKNGFTICEYNFFCRYGEIDIIASKKELMVFVEVKTRTTKTNFLHELVPLSKQQKMIKTMKHYSAKLTQEYAYRFDVAFVYDDVIEYIEGAFTSENY